MGIRGAKPEDNKEIATLLDQLGYPRTESILDAKLNSMLGHPDEVLLVYEAEGRVVAFLSLHFIPQIALMGDFARISYLVVDEEYRGHGIGQKMEEYCVRLAKERHCDRVELHSHSRRVDAHRFYYRQGYVESPKYLMKTL